MRWCSHLCRNYMRSFRFGPVIEVFLFFFYLCRILQICVKLKEFIKFYKRSGSHSYLLTSFGSTLCKS